MTNRGQTTTNRGQMLLTALILLAVAARGTLVRADLSADQVRTSIERAVSFLERQQNRNGSWNEYAGFPGGVTSLCTLALLNAGVPPDDPRIQKALSILREIRPAQTYVVSLQTMVFCAAEPKKDLLTIRQNVRWLENTQIQVGERKGGWSYPSHASGSSGDPSNSQFALLALHEAERVGVKVNAKTWRLALGYWQNLQNPDGSWAYVKGAAGTGSMTSAGITSMIIASGQLSPGDAEIVDGTVRCCGKQEVNLIIENGIRWLERNFSVEVNPTVRDGASYWLYYLYGVERVGRMTNQRFLGNHDWYREGCDVLIRSQDNLTGFWKGKGIVEETNPVVGTSLGLLFMAKGRRPVLVAKLKHDPPGNWNNHRHDLANLTSYVEKLWQRDLTWQIVSSSAATVEDLLQSPVLFISGRDAPVFTPEEKQRLRDYVDRGGFIFAEGCCGGSGFDAGFRKLMQEIFPEQEYQLRLLPPEHPIWRTEVPVDPKFTRPLWGIDVGCRTSVVYCPEDLSCYWELSQRGRQVSLPANIQAEVDACLGIGANVLAYATNREVKYKNEFFVAPDVQLAADNFDRGKLYTARLQHPGGCNAAPGALANLLQLAGEKLQIRVDTQPRELAITDPALFRYHIVFMHGRNAFRFTPAERKQLKTYIERGGMLFADAICSSVEFNNSFRQEMAELFPGQPLERIAASDPLFGTQFGGEDLSVVERREPAQAGAGPLKAIARQGEPQLEGIRLGERWAVIYSPHDLSCALESHASLECAGYTRKDAARIGLNVLLYSLHQ